MMHSIALQGTDAVVPASPAQSVLDACLEQGLAMPYNCRSGECGECLARLVSGSVHELPGADPAVYSAAMRDDGLILTCLCYARSDLVLGVPLRDHPAPPIRAFEGMVERVTRFGPRTMQVVIRCPEAIEFRGGQYFEWWPLGATQPRSYSAANRPGSNRLEFLVRLYEKGQVSTMLQRSELAAGDELTLRGPFGTYEFDAGAGVPALFVAGGTGIGPVLSIVQEALASGGERELQVYYGARDLAELRCTDAFSELCRAHRRVRFVPVLSDEPAGSSWSGARGTVVDALRESLEDQFGSQAYLCGPPAMVDAATALLQRRGVMAEDIHCDKFVPAHEVAASG